MVPSSQVFVAISCNSSGSLQVSSSWNQEFNFRSSQTLSRSLKASELKSNKSQRYELSKLSDIARCIVEFSANQHGSRFIQQKLESCSAEENHGSPEERKELANQFVRHVSPLSLKYMVAG
ncbi:hypothetical protein M5K25_002010 [Dendrobium thyrsiflorum]|uniref:PUM-HD domain-containing protein n=1 Tax=Dendrobium thyrsiflorum TaxID=117978 RepID=A0ABD0VRX3_DENTH